MKNKTIIVLSQGLTPKNRLPFFLKTHLDYAFKVHHHHKNKIILTGLYPYFFQTPPPETEAQLAKHYLLNLGIEEKYLIKEEKSKDLLSSAYYLNKLLNKRKIDNILIITSSLQAQRIEFVFSTILSPYIKISFDYLEPQLSPDLLWEFFIQEKFMLENTKAFLKKINLKNLSQYFFDSNFYNNQSVGLIKKLIHHQKISRLKAPTHYSLKNILSAKNKVFTNYHLLPKTLRKDTQSDFWSGRFLSFHAKDPKSTYYTLKFLIYPTDKSTFKKEVTTTTYLKEKNITFIPTIVDKNTKHAPYWYLYKTIPGKIAGHFSINYSFSDFFYTPFTIKKLTNHLEKLHQLDPKPLKLKKWTSKKYRYQFQRKLKKIKNNKPFTKSKTLQKATNYFIKNSALFDKFPLYISHNDLHPANIIINQTKKQLFFIDFEHIYLNNISADFCFIYLLSWNNPNYQKQFLSSFFSTLTPNQKDQFNKIFPLTYTFFLIWFLESILRWKDRSDTKTFQSAKKYIYTTLKKTTSLNFNLSSLT